MRLCREPRAAALPETRRGIYRDRFRSCGRARDNARSPNPATRSTSASRAASRLSAPASAISSRARRASVAPLAITMITDLALPQRIFVKEDLVRRKPSGLCVSAFEPSAAPPIAPPAPSSAAPASPTASTGPTPGIKRRRGDPEFEPARHSQSAAPDTPPMRSSDGSGLFGVGCRHRVDRLSRKRPGSQVDVVGIEARAAQFGIRFASCFGGSKNCGNWFHSVIDRAIQCPVCTRQVATCDLVNTRSGRAAQ